MSLTLEYVKQLQEDFDRRHAGAVEFFEKINQDNLQVLEHLIVCLIGEVGEFSNVVKKVHRGDLALADAKAALDEEIVDIFIYLIKIINQFDVDIEKGFLDKLQKNKDKFFGYRK